jgi:hypothetical protein
MTAPMQTHASPPFTPGQLVDAGRRAETEGRVDLAVQFYRALTEHFADAPQVAEAHAALGRIGAWHANGTWQGNAAVPAVVHRKLRRLTAPGRDRYAGGRVLARAFGVLGWLVALGGAGGAPAYLLLRAEPFARTEWLLPMAGGATGSLLLGFGVVLAAHVARAQFDQAAATHDLIAIERARLGLDA